MSQRAFHRLTYAEYLALEATSDVRHAFHDGELLAMAGGKPVEAALVARATGLLGATLRGGRFQPYSGSLRVYFPDADEASYGDLTVVCGDVLHHDADPDAAINPTLVIEVLSDSTEAWDRGGKFRLYASLPSFVEYVLVDQHEPIVEVYRRDADGSWVLHRYRPGEVAGLGSIDVRLPVDELYAGIQLTPRARPSPG